MLFLNISEIFKIFPIFGMIAFHITHTDCMITNTLELLTIFSTNAPSATLVSAHHRV